MGYITFDQLKSTVTKLKNYIDEKKAKVTQTLTTGTEIGSVDGTKLYAPSGGSGAVSSVNGKTGAVTLDASDVGALPDTYSAPVSSVNGKTGAVQLTASDVGAKPSSYTAPVSSVNGKTGAVQLSLGDSVAVTQKQTSGTNIADLEINGVTTPLYAPSGGSGGGSTVSVRQTITEGEEIGGISVDGVETKLYSNIEIEYIVGTQTTGTSSWTGVTKDKTLKVGKIIAYKLPYASSSAAASLKLTLADGTQTAAIPLRRLGSSPVTTQFTVNNVLLLVYDGTYWRVSAYQDTTYTPHSLGFGYATCATAEATVAKIASLTYYNLIKNGFVAVRFTYAVPANATLNINSRGAKPIYYNNAAITAGVIDAGDTVLFVYDGTHYMLVAKDKVTGGGGSTVSVTQKETTGTNIADITVDGVTTQLFAPSGGGGSSTLTTIETTAITIPQQQLKDDAHNMQPIFLQITCNDNFNYACFGLCHAEINNGVMLVYVHQLWGHAYERVFGQPTGTLREIIPLLTVPFSTLMENFTVPATLVSGDVYEVSGNATFKSQYIRGTYAYRESIVSLT